MRIFASQGRQDALRNVKKGIEELRYSTPFTPYFILIGARVG